MNPIRLTSVTLAISACVLLLIAGASSADSADTKVDCSSAKEWNGGAAPYKKGDLLAYKPLSNIRTLYKCMKETCTSSPWAATEDVWKKLGECK